MQQGAKSAIMPAMNDEISDAPIKKSIIIELRLRQTSIPSGAVV